ncbi:type IV secretory system conjugative DNA transfer family protein [Halorientalis sp. IM1011]|uniref:type IV secretory system conjugative DNA transfer family protein n=1 Tax=Halorientalis sp. IM1011 TaxID=1932360 RepID=UPI0012FADE1A|nr:TraM recognition domain-containing protein [Halorientalis sp. IM1011]
MVFDRFTDDGDSEECADSEQSDNQGEGPTTIAGEPYRVTVTDYTRVGGKRVLAETESGETVAGPHVRKMLESGNSDPEKPLWIGYNEGAQTGFREAPVRFPALFRHLWLSGTTGAGKTTVLQNNAVQYAYAGHGFCNIDPKASGDTLELLQQLPSHRLDDVILLEPGTDTYEKTIGINMLDMPETDSESELEAEVESRIENLRAIFDSGSHQTDWGVNMDTILSSVGRAMLRHNADADPDERYSIIDMYFLLKRATRRERFAREVVEEDPYMEYLLDVAEMDDETIQPLTKRIKDWVENAVIRKIIACRESTIDWDDIVNNDRILLVRIPVDNEDIHQMVTLTVLRNLWSAKKRQDRDDEIPTKPYFLQVDEFEKVANDHLDVKGMLARARSMRMSVTLGTQYPGQIEEEFPDTKRAMENNCNTLLALKTPGEHDSRLLMKRFKGYEAEDVQSISLYNAWTKIPLAGGRESEPVKIKTFAPYPPLRSLDEVHTAIEASLDQYGTTPLTDDEIQRNLKHADAGEYVDAVDETDEDGTDAGSIPTRTILEGVFAAQNRPEVGVDDQGFVALEDAEREIERRIGDTGYQSQLSNAIEKTLYSGEYAVVDRRSGQSAVKLTDDGLVELFRQDTGSSASGGGDDHRVILQKSYEAFTKLGFVTRLPTQEGDELADGIADLPIDPYQETARREILEKEQTLREGYPAVWELSDGRHVNIEAETSTIEKPKQTLTNLRKAVNSGRLCVFTLKDESASKGEFGYWGRRGEQVLYDSWREGNGTVIDYDRLTFASSVDDGHRHFYNKASFVEFDDGVYALRPTYEEDIERSLEIEWQETAEGIVCRDSHGSVHARFDDTYELEKPSPNAFPAYYEYDRSEQEFVVWENGDKRLYNSREELEADWKRIYAPFVPEIEFDRMPSEEDFVFIVFPDADNESFEEPQIYEKGEVRSLHRDIEVRDAPSVEETGPDSAGMSVQPDRESSSDENDEIDEFVQLMAGSEDGVSSDEN